MILCSQIDFFQALISLKSQICGFQLICSWSIVTSRLICLQVCLPTWSHCSVWSVNTATRFECPGLLNSSTPGRSRPALSPSNNSWVQGLQGGWCTGWQPKWLFPSQYRTPVHEGEWAGLQQQKAAFLLWVRSQDLIFNFQKHEWSDHGWKIETILWAPQHLPREPSRSQSTMELAEATSRLPSWWTVQLEVFFRGCNWQYLPSF